jgi:hypothetical protein
MKPGKTWFEILSDHSCERKMVPRDKIIRIRHANEKLQIGIMKMDINSRIAKPDINFPTN